MLSDERLAICMPQARELSLSKTSANLKNACLETFKREPSMRVYGMVEVASTIMERKDMVPCSWHVWLYICAEWGGEECVIIKQISSQFAYE